MRETLSLFIGWDPREAEVADVCRHSILRRSDPAALEIHYIKLTELRERGLYTRPTEIRDGRLWDVISEAPMSTEFAISRFFVPVLAARGGWAVFCDCDFLWRVDIRDLLALADASKALMCVQHDHVPKETVKMDSQAQLRYARKNWSSMMLWNLEHPANARLTLDMLNTVPGRDLHRFCWLEDEEIGALPATWNWLEGTTDASIEPKVIHYTRGGPWFPEWRDVAYAEPWLEEQSHFHSKHASK